MSLITFYIDHNDAHRVIFYLSQACPVDGEDADLLTNVVEQMRLKMSRQLPRALLIAPDIDPTHTFKCFYCKTRQPSALMDKHIPACKRSVSERLQKMPDELKKMMRREFGE
jgi:hypothetical protein